MPNFLLNVDGCNSLLKQITFKNAQLQKLRKTNNIAEFYVLFAHVYTSIFVTLNSFESPHSKLSMKQYYNCNEIDQFKTDLELFKTITSDGSNSAKHLNDFNEIIIKPFSVKIYKPKTKQEDLYWQYFKSISELYEFQYNSQCEMDVFLTLMFVNNDNTSQWEIHPELTYITLKEYSNVIRRILMHYLVQRNKLLVEIENCYKQIVLAKVFSK